ncbi:ABC1 family-domain-containing protein, partial [Thamnocephalis sphaerospora]
RTATVATPLACGLYAWDRWYGAEVLSRNGRALLAAGLITADYKLNFRADQPPEALSELHKRVAERVLRVCQRNGGLYIKFGQALALQSAVLPPEYNRVMQVLLDDAPSVPYAQVEQILREELGQSPDELFLNFSHTPVASASIAQVHRAQLSDGTQVAVKVQKPTIRPQMDWDLRAYALLTKFFEWAFELPVSSFAETVQDHLRQETDFIREGRNAEACARAIQDEPRLRDRVYVPRIFWEHTAGRVLTAEWAEGRRLADAPALTEAGFDMAEAMRIMVDLFAHQIFVSGFVHCDPHPGNLLVRQDPRRSRGKPMLVLLDHGLYVRCRPSFRQEQCRLWTALFTNDHEALRTVCEAWGIGDVTTFASATLMRPYRAGQSAAELSAPVQARDVYALQMQAKERARTVLANEQRIPYELVLVARNMNMVRACNQALGSPVNRIGVMADWAARGL